jgi:hypothetical protein
MYKNIKWTQIIEDESEIVHTSALYILPIDPETVRLIYVDDVGVKRELSALGADANYVHTQTVPLKIWVINHPLHKKVSVEIQDTAGTQMIGKIVKNDGVQVILEFNFPFSGIAILN